jgi:hypothetical protein
VPVGDQADRRSDRERDAHDPLRPLLYNYVDAYYWRAWNYHQLKKLAEARADINEAKSLAVTANI